MIKLIKFLHRDSIILLLFCGYGNHQGKNGYPNNGRGGGCGRSVGYRVKNMMWVHERRWRHGWWWRRQIQRKRSGKDGRAA
ncbi:hypothetical protein L1987_42571 [Smallanthus sonchifolius]|uniref:Uncharacterized protein n=1 Tax=Smallanthus sonchifolius TaxID=185202 RepID=A0ACB9GJ44_9ASTR|nr:hypothetical protein L1987_42571 [Smallanthus sonchifolius]